MLHVRESRATAKKKRGVRETTASWVFIYVDAAGKTRSMGLGKYSDVSLK